MDLITYLRNQGAKTASKVMGPNGAFISIKYADDSVGTMPVGKKSQEGTLKEFGVLETEDGTTIATISQYEEQESVEL